MRILTAAATYFGVVFGAGFVFGAIRVPFLVPRVGERVAELIELPFMVVIVLLVARWQQRRTPDLGSMRQLVVGVVALAFMLVAECALGAIQGRSPIEVVLGHDPVSGTLYYVALVLFAIAPWAWARVAMRPIPTRSKGVRGSSTSTAT